MYEISIWTDAQTGLTAINFETYERAKEHLRRQAAFFRDRGYEEIAAETETSEIQGNPADFKYAEYHTIVHPNLTQVTSIDFSDPDQSNAVLERIEDSLLRVRDQIVNAGMLNGLPTEDEVWLRINSPHDWFDHVMKIQRPVRP